MKKQLDQLHRVCVYYMYNKPPESLKYNYFLLTKRLVPVSHRQLATILVIAEMKLNLDLSHLIFL